MSQFDGRLNSGKESCQLDTLRRIRAESVLDLCHMIQKKYARMWWQFKRENKCMHTRQQVCEGEPLFNTQSLDVCRGGLV